MTALNLTETNATKLTLKIKAMASAPRLRIEGDKLFPELTRITCRVCEREERVSLDHPALLCSVCLGDVSTTDAHVSGIYAAALAFFMDASENLRTAVEQSSERAWWARVDAARIDADRGVFATAWARAKSSGGEKLRLCELSEVCDREAIKLEPLNAWYTDAMRELKAARAFLGEPVEV